MDAMRAMQMPWKALGIAVALLAFSVAAAAALDCSAVNCPSGVPYFNPTTNTCSCGPLGCGDLVCGAEESYKNCPLDCPLASCGNKVCDALESPVNCPMDCQPVCGNYICELGENIINCSADCRETVRCCNWVIDAYGGRAGCAQYCSSCGDGKCDAGLGETIASCPKDCRESVCGDGVCDVASGENDVSCPRDCRGDVSCKVHADCLGRQVRGKNVDYVVGQQYPLLGENRFVVGACRENVCVIETEVEGVRCGDNYCDGKAESCNPNSVEKLFCETDCGVCKEMELELASLAADRPSIRAGDTLVLTVEVKNVGLAASDAFRILVYVAGVGGEEDEMIASFDLEELPVTNLQTEYASIVGYLEALHPPLKPVIAFLQGATGGNKPPVAELKVLPAYGTAPLRVTIDVSGSHDPDGTIRLYQLDVDGDGKTDISFEPPATSVEYVFEEPGVNVVNLTVHDADLIQPRSGFDFTKVLVLQAPLRRTFEIKTTPEMCGPQTFIVALETLDSDESNNLQTITVDVLCELPPEPVIDAEPSVGLPPLTVSFNGSKSRDPDGEIVSLRWDLGDGAVSAEERVVHTFAAEGEYVVSLTAVDNEGRTGTAEKRIRVGVPPNAVLTASPLEGPLPLRVNVASVGSSDADGSIEAVKWFLDGEPVLEAPAGEVVVTERGEHELKLVVQDDKGLTDEAAQTVVGGFRPQARVAGPNSLFLGTSAEFSGAESSDADGEIRDYQWEWGDGEKSIGPKARHAFKDVGHFTVKLRVTDDTGVAGTATKSVKVSGSDGTDLSARKLEPLTGAVGQNSEFTLVYQVTNGGEVDAGAFEVTLREGSLEGKVLAKRDIGGLAALQKTTIAFEVEAGKALGEKKYVLVLDSREQVKETNELNNIVETALLVTLQEICGNSVDDDLDGYVDEGCVACETEKGCLEVCGNGFDDDNDGIADEGCEGTNMLISGLPLNVSVVKARAAVGEGQEVLVQHPVSGGIREALVKVTSPSGNVTESYTDEKGVARFRLEEAGKHRVEVVKYSLSAETTFESLSPFTALQENVLGLPGLLFGPDAYELPLLVMVLLLLSVIAGVLAFDRSERLFEEEFELVKTPAQLAWERSVRTGIAVLFVLVPLFVNRLTGFEFGIGLVVLEIMLLFLVAYFEGEK